jgi:hypothetical protein
MHWKHVQEQFEVTCMLGMTLKEENYQIFKDAFEKEVERTIHPIC